MQERVKARREQETLLENSPVAEPQSNGDVERANRDVEDQARTLKDALEERVGETIPPESSVIPWLIEHSAWLYNHCHEGRDRMTASEREKGAKSSQPLAEFGELVLFRPLRSEHGRESGGQEKFEPRLEDGVYLGIEDRSGVSRVGTAHGVVKARDIRRKPASERWCAEALRMFTGTPWDPTPDGSEEVDGTPVGNPLDPRPRIVEHSEPGMVARRVRLNREDFEVHGYTDHCDGCLQLRLGRAARSHNERCRSRMEAAIAGESEEGRRRVEAGHGRIAEAEARRKEKTARDEAQRGAPGPEAGAAPAPEEASAPAQGACPAPEFLPPPASVKNWFLGDGRQWAVWQAAGLPKGKYATWRRKYLDARMRDMRGASTVDGPVQEDEPEHRRHSVPENEAEAAAPQGQRADSEIEPEAKRHEAADVDGLISVEQRGVPCVCRHCDGSFGSRNLMFKHLKEFGLEKHDLIGSVSQSSVGRVVADDHAENGAIKKHNFPPSKC